MNEYDDRSEYEYMQSQNEQAEWEASESARGEAEAEAYNEFYENEILPLAKYMHKTYEELAIKRGWKTQKECRVEYKDLPIKNRQVMENLAEKLLTDYFKKKS